MYERFTYRARIVMQVANQEAQRLNHNFIGSEHMLLGLIKEGSGIAADVLKNLDIDLRQIRLEVEMLVQGTGTTSLRSASCGKARGPRSDLEHAMEERKSEPQTICRHGAYSPRPVARAGRRCLANVDEPRIKLEEVREEVLNLLGRRNRRK